MYSHSEVSVDQKHIDLEWLNIAPVLPAASITDLTLAYFT